VAEAEAAFRRAVMLDPQSADAAVGLGIVLQNLGRTDEAIAEYQRAIAIAPSSAEAWSNLGVSLRGLGRNEEALEAYRRALSIRPDFVDAMLNLASLLQGLGRIEEAVEWFGRAAALRSDDADVLSMLGGALKQAGRSAEAFELLRRVVELRPGHPDALNNFGSALVELGRHKEAAQQFRKALQLDPNHVVAAYNLGSTLHELGELEEAIEMYQRAIALQPDAFYALNNLAVALRFGGRLEESIRAHHQALAVQPEIKLASDLLLAVQSHPGYDAAAIREELDLWNRQFARPLAGSVRPHINDRDPDRTLRVGFVSTYLDGHPAGRFMLPLLSHYDRRRLEVCCYSDVAAPDQMTENLRSLSRVWHDTAKMSDQELAQLIRSDRIDILVDLGMHTRRNRLLVFARKPAPVQAAYLAYCGSTGLETIDYRISDPFLDPDDLDQKYYSERTVRLKSYWCYPEPPEAPPVNALPAAQSGHVTFGCLNEILKLNDRTLSTWIEVLRGVPNSRLIAHGPRDFDRRRIGRAFAVAGIDPARVECVGMLPMVEYFRQYHRIDIALDPTPWPGGTTTCDALWMGVPVVSVIGKTALSRGGLSILSNVGLPELVGRDSDQQVQIAAALAQDVPRLANLRSSLRQQVRQSPLMDAPAFACDFGAVLRQMWRNWCVQPG
jgi:predicted O-linked N-acetylglucosamine transferase (SPINDLY family)